MKVAQATIHWIGDSAPPCGATYSSVSHWEEQADDESWSIVADIVAALDTREFAARIRFLVDQAPHQLLHVGSRFEIFEGETKVATGEVTSDAKDSAWQPAFPAKAAPAIS